MRPAAPKYGLSRENLQVILKRNNLENRVSLLVGPLDLKDFVEDFAQNSDKNYACILYMQSRLPLSHKSCIVLAKQENGIVDAIFSDATDASSPTMLSEMGLTNKALSKFAKNGKTFVNNYARIGAEKGCVGFAVNDVMFFSRIEDGVALVDRLESFKLSQSAEGNIIFHDLLPKLMENCQFLDPEKDNSIAAYLRRNAGKITREESEILKGVSTFNPRNDQLILDLEREIEEDKKAKDLARRERNSLNRRTSRDTTTSHAEAVRKRQADEQINLDDPCAKVCVIS